MEVLATAQLELSLNQQPTQDLQCIFCLHSLHLRKELRGILRPFPEMKPRPLNGQAQFSGQVFDLTALPDLSMEPTTLRFIDR